MKKHYLALAGVLAVTLAAPAVAQDAAWPAAKPIRVLVGFPPGGSIDAIARTFSEALGKRLNQTVVVENRGGAAGMIAAEEVSRQAPDGYTLLLNPGGPLMDKPPVDIFDDAQFTQIIRLTESPQLVAVAASTPYETLAQLVEASKRSANGLSYASSGTGSVQHLLGEIIAQASGAKFVHVPYRGGGQAITDLVAGHIPAGVLGAVPLLPHIAAGRVRALAVNTRERISALPNVPTLTEAGITGVTLNAWTGLTGPKGLPAAITERLAATVMDAMQDPALKARMDGLGQVLSPLSGAAFVQFARADRDFQLRFMRERNIPLN